MVLAVDEFEGASSSGCINTTIEVIGQSLFQIRAEADVEFAILVTQKHVAQYWSFAVMRGGYQGFGGPQVVKSPSLRSGETWAP